MIQQRKSKGRRRRHGESQPPQQSSATQDEPQEAWEDDPEASQEQPGPSQEMPPPSQPPSQDSQGSSQLLSFKQAVILTECTQVCSMSSLIVISSYTEYVKGNVMSYLVLICYNFRLTFFTVWSFFSKSFYICGVAVNKVFVV